VTVRLGTGVIPCHFGLHQLHVDDYYYKPQRIWYVAMGNITAKQWGKKIKRELRIMPLKEIHLPALKSSISSFSTEFSFCISFFYLFQFFFLIHEERGDFDWLDPKMASFLS
jgi:hypothetical protein